MIANGTIGGYRWFAVDDAHPELGETVLVCRATDMSVTSAVATTDGWVDRTGAILTDVAAWCNIPRPPAPEWIAAACQSAAM